jgi:Tol biopolymer transport system component
MLLCNLPVAPTSVAKAGKPVPQVPRPICFWGTLSKRASPGILRADLNGDSILRINGRSESWQWPRWSPDGKSIGCYFSFGALMVMNPDGTNEQVVVNGGAFNAWNLSRPGVLNSEFLKDYVCWLGNDAFVFAGRTTYDASVVGGTPGKTLTDDRLFIVDAAGTFAPLTELGGPNEDSAPHWSAALNKVAFIRFTWERQIYSINPDGSGLQQITSGNEFGGDWSDLEEVVWNHTGDRLAVTVRESTGLGLYILDVDLNQAEPGLGGRVTASTRFLMPESSEFYAFSPSWSPSGNRIVCSYIGVLNGWSGYHLVVAQVPSGALTEVCGPHSQLGGADWDPLDVN